MNANKMTREDLVKFLQSGRGKLFLQKQDEKWDKLMQAARESGFIVYAYGGVCALSTYKEIVEADGTEEAAKVLQMNNVEIPV